MPEVPIEWLGLISTACFTASYLPQLIRTYRTRTVEGLSLAYWSILLTGYVTGLGYIAPMHNRLLNFTYGAGLLCALGMWIACVRFRR